jgi:hypothetical protein
MILDRLAGINSGDYLESHRWAAACEVRAKCSLWVSGGQLGYDAGWEELLHNDQYSLEDYGKLAPTIGRIGHHRGRRRPGADHGQLE